ncbi:hypothetical protein DTL42_19540 [Bremerella cremea]|uniref:Uncharacterized protein n=1 Tax=Bremerella cremea TaxID=1031537 RepID=A0A368KPB8_9BACT|nr:hypothetical protein [Bremerella cremea]RCS42266.1 hypothetical protein DTL42_19540 [Bremerella cremea]
MTPAAPSGANDPDTGDIYSGLDRFGRVKENRWYNYRSSADVDRIKYGYDRASNRTWRQNVVANSLSQPFDKLYHYDAISNKSRPSAGRWIPPTTGRNTWKMPMEREPGI